MIATALLAWWILAAPPPAHLSALAPDALDAPVSATPVPVFAPAESETPDGVDPLHGACNAAPDRWIVPQPYEAPRIDTLTTHSAEPTLVDCGVANGVPVHENPHFADSFAPGATLWAFASYSDHRNGEVTHFSVLRPDASVETSWDFDLASENLPKPFYSGTAWDWSVTLPADAQAGTWTLEAAFEDQLYQHAFTVTGTTTTHGHSRHARPAREPPVRH